MATDNYFVVHRTGDLRHPRVEFFFDSKNRVSVASALNAAREYAQLATDLAQAESDATTAASKATPQIVDGTPVRVFAHGTRGLGDLHCLGGCAICCPHAGDELDEPDPPEVGSAA